MPMAIAIGDDSFKDRPIYVRVTSIGERRNCWYVIEEKPRAAESTSSSSSSDIDEEDGNDILIECESESDRIRRLSVPDSELQYNSLVVLKSRVYLIGGDVEIQKNKDGTTDETKIGYRHFDLGVGGQWRLNGGKVINDQFGAAAVGHDGLIYSVGIEQYRLFPGGMVEKLPTPPRLSHQVGIYESRLLGLTRRKLFIYTIGAGVNNSNLLLSYDLESGEWNEDYDNFFGYWSTGVVLYDDRYLFSFGTQNPIPPRRKKVVPGIYVFDIERCQWLPRPVEGLRTDGTVLPRAYRTKPEWYHIDDYMGPGFSPFLFQIGNKHNDHKLALLWGSRGTRPKSVVPHCLMIWSKFILHMHASPETTTADDQIPHFSARSLSRGICPLDDSTYELLNCAPGIKRVGGHMNFAIRTQKRLRQIHLEDEKIYRGFQDFVLGVYDVQATAALNQNLSDIFLLKDPR